MVKADFKGFGGGLLPQVSISARIDSCFYCLKQKPPEGGGSFGVWATGLFAVYFSETFTCLVKLCKGLFWVFS